MKRSTVEQVRRQLADAEDKIGRLSAVIRERADSREVLANELDALKVTLRETQASRDLTEERAAKALAEAQRLTEQTRTLTAGVMASTLTHGRTRGILYVLTRLVLSNDVEAAKAVARGVKDEVGS